MPKKILQVIDTPYRCTLEEQDDPAVWITHAMRAAGADLALLLRGSAINYVVRAQDAGGLSFGGRRQTQPPQLAHDVAKLVEKGVPVYVVQDDVTKRGLERRALIDGIELVPQGGIARLFERFDAIWHW